MRESLLCYSNRGSKTVPISIIIIALVGLAFAGVVIFQGAVDISQSQDEAATTKEIETITQSSNSSPTKTSMRNPTSTSFPTTIPTGGPTLTPTFTPTTTPTLTATSTATTTKSPVENDRYDEFMGTLTAEAEVDADTPIRLRGWRVVEGGLLIISMNLADKSGDNLSRVREVNTLITSGFAQAVYHHDNGRIDGKIPQQLRIAEVNNSRTPAKTLYLNTSLARDYYLDKISAPEFSKTYWETERNMTKQEQEYIRELDKSAGNVTIHNESAK